MRVNLLAPEVRANPYPVYAALRRDSPVCQVDPGGLWAITRYADVMTVLQNPRLFSSEGFRVLLKPAWLGHNPFADSMISMDPPRHTRLRETIDRAFGPVTLARLEPRIRAYAERFASRLPVGRSVDFIEHFSSPLCAGVMGDLLGLGPALQPRFKRWADDLTSITGTAPEDLARQGEIRDTVAEFDQYATEVLAQRRQEPCEDFVTELLRAQVGGVALTEAELHAFLFVVLVSGLEPGVHLVNHAALLLARYPEVQARLRVDRSLVFPFIEEVLRCETSVHAIPRYTTADTELGGVALPRGSRLLVMLASASRDEARFPDAERFSLDRGGLQELSFGAGAHFCLGANLARLQARLSVEALLARYGRISPGPEPLVWNRSMTVRGPVTLPLRFQLH